MAITIGCNPECTCSRCCVQYKPISLLTDLLLTPPLPKEQMMTKWIKVEDRLPIEKSFLGKIKDGSIHVFTNYGDACYTGGWEHCHYCGGQSLGYLPNQGRSSDMKEITHWMPLPEKTYD